MTAGDKHGMNNPIMTIDTPDFLMTYAMVLGMVLHGLGIRFSPVPCGGSNRISALHCMGFGFGKASPALGQQHDCTMSSRLVTYDERKRTILYQRYDTIPCRFSCEVEIVFACILPLPDNPMST